MKHFTLNLLILVFSKLSLAQDPHFSQFHTQSIYLNPAFTGSSIHPVFSASYRNQWPDLQGNYKTGIFSYHQYLKLIKGGIGGYVMYDDAGNGTLSSTYINLNYSPHFEIANTFVIKPAISIGYIQRHINWDDLTFGDMIDSRYGFSYPSIAKPNTIKSFFDFNAGVLFYTNNIYAGYGLHHFTQPEEAFITPEPGSTLPMKHTVNIGTTTQLSDIPDQSVFGIDLIYQSQRDFRMWLPTVTYKWKVIRVGMGYRVSGNDNADAIIYYGGLQINSIRLSYSYDKTVSKLASYSGGSHEISASYLIPSRPKDVAKKALKMVSF